MTDLANLEAQLRTLLKGEFSSLTISFNDHAANYCDVKKAIEYYDYYAHADFVSDAEKDRAIETNSVWTVHWYPNTPVGFFCVGASTLEAAIKGALES